MDISLQLNPEVIGWYFQTLKLRSRQAYTGRYEMFPQCSSLWNTFKYMAEFFLPFGGGVRSPENLLLHTLPLLFMHGCSW